MSSLEIDELSALGEWLSSFPQLEELASNKENFFLVDEKECSSNSDIESAILVATAEVCDIAERVPWSQNAEEVDVWITVLSLTRKVVANRRKSMDQPKLKTPNLWKDYNKYVGLSNLLSIAVSHKDLQLRKAYIERIMKLSPTTQRLLMSLIEKRKKLNTKTKTSPKINRRHSEDSKFSAPVGTRENNDESISPKVDKDMLSINRDNLSKGNGITGHSSQFNESNRDTMIPPKNVSKHYLIEEELLQSEDINRRNFHDAFGTPVKEPLAKRLPPPSAERHLKGQSISRNIFSPGLGDTAEYESQVQGLRDENEELLRELKRSQQKEKELSKKMDDLDGNFRKRMLTVEREAREREDKMRHDHKREIFQIQNKLVQMTDECNTVKDERNELIKIKDEMEMISHNNMLLEETTERLRTYKEKVEQLTDIKDALQREENAHSRSVEENLRLKNELQNLQPLKRQLEDYKSRAVDAEVRLTDCQDELMKLKEHKLASSVVNTQMEQYVIAQEAEINELLRRVQQNDVANNEDSGVGDGISELNPELKKEILSLRNENEQLRAFAEKRREDQVSKLEQSAEDKNMLAERYKDQFLTTKNKLESTEISLVDSKNKLEKLKDEIKSATRLAERYKSQFMSTKSQLESTQLSLQDSKNRECFLRKEVADSLTKLKHSEIELEETSNQLSKCEEDLNTGIHRESKLEKELASWTKEANGQQEKCEDLSRKLTIKTKELEDILRKERTLKDEKSRLENDVRLLRERCDGLVDELQHFTVELEQSHCRESRLEISVKEWMEKVQESDKHNKRISSTLLERTEELQTSKQVLTDVENKLSESLLSKAELEGEIQAVTRELRETQFSLEEKCKLLDQNMQRYLDLQNDLSDMTSRAEDAENISTQRMEQIQILQENLQDAEKMIQTLVNERDNLVSSVEEWTSQTEIARSNNKNLENKLEQTEDLLKKTEDMLVDAQASIKTISKEKDVLTSSVAKLTTKNDETECLVKSLKSELERTVRSLKNTEDKLSQSQILNNDRMRETEVIVLENKNLKEEISRSKNTISNLRNELIETNEGLKSLHETIKQKDQRLFSTNKSLREAENSILSLQNAISKTQKNLDSSTQNIKNIEARENVLEKKLQDRTHTIQSLQNELLEAKENLRLSHKKADALDEREKLSNEQLKDAELMLSELEDSIQKEVQASEKISTTLKKCEAQKSKMKLDFDSREDKLLRSLESEKEKGQKLRQELGEVKNKLNVMQDSLSSVQHREKMLQHENIKLEDKKREYENELLSLKSNMDEALEQSSKSLQSVRDLMNAKAQKELKDLQCNMNQLLEDERKAKRQQDVLYKEQTTKLNKEYEDELIRLKKCNEAELQKFIEEKEKESKLLNEENDEKIKLMKKNAKQEKDELMETGKTMIKEIKEKKEKEIKDLNDDVNFLEKKIIKEEDEKKRLGQQFQNKIIEYKKKLQLASGRINTLSTDNNDFEDRVKYLEREKSKLREENDRYRRRLGGRSGTDSALQSQLETLQNEFKNAIDENRDLKRKLKSEGFCSLSSIGEDNESRPYTRNRANQSTLLQLRAEYEETIESLNDEKRELIMKNSAAITDVQKAEKRAWLVEQDNSLLKQDLTSLSLSNERLENALASFRQESISVGKDSFTEMISVSEDSIIPKPPTLGKTSQFDDTSLVGRTYDVSQNRESKDVGILGTNKGFTNGSRTHLAFGLSSPDQDTKRFVHAATLHNPYRYQPKK